MNREQYQTLCQVEVDTLAKKYDRLLLEYVRGRRRKKVGVVVAARNDQGEILLGYSLCHTKKDIFDPAIGKYKALTRLAPPSLQFIDEAPQSVQKPLLKLLGRAQRFFRTGT